VPGFDAETETLAVAAPPSPASGGRPRRFTAVVLDRETRHSKGVDIP